MAGKGKGTSSNKKSSGAERQTLIMWALLARENAVAFQKDLKPEPSKADREALAAVGLISWWKLKSGAIRIEVTEKGWAWANDNLSAALPTQSTAGAEILRGWLIKLQAFMTARSLVLADILPTQSPQADKLNGGGPKKTDETPFGSLRERIRAAYLASTGGSFSERAFLKDIREHLKDVDQKALNDALTRMQQEEQAVLYPLDNYAEITEADRKAAIHFAGEPRHILWIKR